MKVLDEVFSSFHHTLSVLPLPEEISMESHRIEDFTKCWYIVSRKETPGVTETCTSDHEPIEILVKGSIFDLKIPLLARRMHQMRLALVLVFRSNLFAFDKNFPLGFLSFLTCSGIHLPISLFSSILRMNYFSCPVIV